MTRRDQQDTRVQRQPVAVGDGQVVRRAVISDSVHGPGQRVGGLGQAAQGTFTLLLPVGPR
ncbi:hypothetical protein [Streptomyces sp. NPDC054804]